MKERRARGRSADRSLEFEIELAGKERRGGVALMPGARNVIAARKSARVVCCNGLYGFPNHAGTSVDHKTVVALVAARSIPLRTKRDARLRRRRHLCSPIEIAVSEKGKLRQIDRSSGHCAPLRNLLPTLFLPRERVDDVKVTDGATKRHFVELRRMQLRNVSSIPSWL